MSKVITRFGPQPAIKQGRRPKFYECGICNCYHPANWDGDCRDNENRFSPDELDNKYGLFEWVEVPMPGSE